MSKVDIPPTNVKIEPLPDGHPKRGLPKGQIDTIAPNNNSDCEPIRFIPDQKGEAKKTLSSSSCCSLRGGCTPRPKEAKGGASGGSECRGLGTYDTVRLTSLGVQATDIVDPYGWTIGKGTTLGDFLDDSTMPRISKRIYLDTEGREVEKGQHRATIGIDYIPSGGKMEQYGLADLTVLTIPSAPAMMYGDPTQPLLPEHVSDWLERVQTVVARHVHCDASTFNVSRLDSSTVYQMTEGVPLYTGFFNAITPAQQRRTNKKYYEGQSIQFFNNSQSVGMYDKGAKEDHHAFLDALSQSTNLLRFEAQTKKREAVVSTYGKVLALDLLKEETIAKAVVKRAKAFDQFFPYNPKLSMEFSNNYNFFRLTKQTNKRNHLDKFGKMLAIQAGLITVEQYDLFMRLEGYTPQYIARHNKAIRDMQAQFVDARNLYQEVKERIEEDLKSVA